MPGRSPPRSGLSGNGVGRVPLIPGRSTTPGRFPLIPGRSLPGRVVPPELIPPRLGFPGAGRAVFPEDPMPAPGEGRVAGDGVGRASEPGRDAEPPRPPDGPSDGRDCGAAGREAGRGVALESDGLETFGRELPPEGRGAGREAGREPPPPPIDGRGGPALPFPADCAGTLIAAMAAIATPIAIQRIILLMVRLLTDASRMAT